MKYNFDKITNRWNTLSIKWDVEKNVLPMWIADMDFETSPEIIEGFKDRIEQGIFGYNVIPDDLFESYIYWWYKRYNFKIQKEWCVFSTGVIPSLSSAIRRVTEIANNVVIMTPVYNIFFNSIINNGRKVLQNELIYRDGKYDIDWKDLEDKLSLEETSALILCNPHNPVGKIWSKEELDKIGKLCAKYNVVVISDEVHCDMTRPGKTYIPFASVSRENLDNSITLIAPTKCFNIAGIQSSIAVIANPKLKHLFERGLNTDECAEANTLASIAPQLAYFKSEQWIDELRDYIFKNKDIVKEYINKEITDITYIDSDALYLVWIDVSKISPNGTLLRDFIKEKTGLYLSDGEEYGNGGLSFLRMNVATQTKNVIDGLNRLKSGIELFKTLQNK
jgi:cystathionine beta-lyase